MHNNDIDFNPIHTYILIEGTLHMQDNYLSKTSKKKKYKFKELPYLLRMATLPCNYFNETNYTTISYTYKLTPHLNHIACNNASSLHGGSVSTIPGSGSNLLLLNNRTSWNLTSGPVQVIKSGIRGAWPKQHILCLLTRWHSLYCVQYSVWHITVESVRAQRFIQMSDW